MTEQARERVSQSWVSELYSCGESFRRRYIEKEHVPATSTQARGTAVHHVAAHGHARQLKAREESPSTPKSIVLRTALPSEDEAADLAATRFEEERRKFGLAAPVDAVASGISPARVIGQDKDAAVRMSRFYVSRVAPYLDPLYVERRVDVDPQDMDIRVSGVIDLGVRDDDGGEVLIDTKTGQRKPNARAADESNQLTTYALLRKLESGKLPKRVALQHIVQEKTALTAPYRVLQLSTRTDADLQVAVNRLNNAIEGARKGVFLANGVGTWKCSPRWCPWFSSCKFVIQPH